MIHKFALRPSGPPEPDVEYLRRTLGLADLDVWRDYYVEFEADKLTDEERDAVCAALADPLGSGTVLVDHPLESDAVMVTHRRGVVDNESSSIVAMCALLGIPAVAGKVGTTYRSASSRLRDVIMAHRFNSTIEELHGTEPCYESLVPAGSYSPAEHYDLRPMTDAELETLGRAGGRNLSLAQMRQIREIQGAEPSVTDVLLEALDARWSDHCAHTTWRSLGNLLGRLVAASRDTANPNIVSMFHDNAGVWDFYDGHALAIKAETHNGPSAIAAYFGQLTKLGGVLRDILGTGLGADPIGCFEYTATGLPEAPAPIAGRIPPQQIAHETIRAIKEYGNTFGVPMMSSRMGFHPAYRAKPFALGGSIGILPTAAAQRGEPRPGDLVVLIGGLTGNEGMHGASASSAGSTMDEAAVQIGAPLEQVKFRKAIIDLRDAGCLRALTDIGGAGLNSAVGEIGESCGVWINTALVPLKTSALPMWRILLSESQERMLLAVPPEAIDSARAILARHQVRTTVIGRFTGNGRYRVSHDPNLDEAGVLAADEPPEGGELGFDVPYDLLGLRLDQQEVGPPPAPRTDGPGWPSFDDGELLEQVIGDTDVASQHFADSQYDSTVQGNTYYGPQYGSDTPVRSGYWAGTPVDGHPGAVVVATAFNPWLFEIHPVLALRQLVCAVLARQVLAGVELGDICLCDNFYTPHSSANWREWLVGMVDELAALTRHFGVPVISGKDSSAGSTSTDEGVVSVPPAVFLTAVGKVPHHARLLTEEWTTPGNLLVLVGPRTGAVGGTVAGRVLGIGDGTLDDVALPEVDAYLAALAAHRGLWRSGSQLGAGGLAAHLVTGSIASGLGVTCEPTAEQLFAEHRCAAVVEIDPADLAFLPPELNAVPVGRLTQEAGVRLGGRELLTPAVRERWTNAFVGRLS